MFDYIASLVNGFFALLSADQWDMWRNWLTTIAGVVALSVAARTYLANSRVRRFEQARLVYAKIRRVHAHEPATFFEAKLAADDVLLIVEDEIATFSENSDKALRVTALVPLLRITLVVHNGSKERIGPAYVAAYDRSAERTLTTSPPIEHVDPESEAVVEIVAAIPTAGEPVVGASLNFLDASGRWWRRHLLEPVRRTRKVEIPSDRGTYWVYTSPQSATGPSAGRREKHVVLPPSWWQRFKARLSKSANSKSP